MHSAGLRDDIDDGARDLNLLVVLAQSCVAHALLLQQIAQLRVLHEHVLRKQIVVHEPRSLFVNQHLLLLDARVQHTYDTVVLHTGLCKYMNKCTY